MARIGQKAMEMAQKVLDKEDATEEEITEALKNLENAIGSLVKKEDTSSPLLIRMKLQIREQIKIPARIRIKRMTRML